MLKYNSLKRFFKPIFKNAPKIRTLKSIALPLHICKLHNEQIKQLSQRYTNNNKPGFDQVN
jgi:hypothetical protein